MNRKERRAARRSGAGPSPLRPGDSPASLLNTALTHHRNGALLEAERLYRQIIAVSPANADAEGRLGAVLMGQGKTSDAIAHFERAAALNPGMFEVHGNLAQAYIWTGRGEQAIEAACRAVELRETPQSKTIFAQCVANARFTADNARFRRLILRALLEGWVRPRDLTRVAISLIKLNPAVRDGIARVNAAWPTRLPADQLLDASALATLPRDELLCRLLECDPITDIGLERLLTSLRHAMLVHAAASDDSQDHLIEFYCAVARQCFVNEYVFSTTDGEAELALRLRASLDEALKAGSPFAALLPVAVASYFPLHSLSNAQRLFDRSWPKPVDALLVQQVREPAQEKQIAATIPALTRIDDDVSRAVQAQYEENPYPRWVRAGPPAQPAILFGHDTPHRLDALIAGCGTGLSTIEFARQAPQAQILAIDLSRASLSYAKRMAQRFSLGNVEFGQADIMSLGSLGRQFDFIDASGVLHHLADPWAGWRILLSLLRPGGFMQVGLYSELARRNVVAVRKLIAERGYRPVIEDIRRCRDEIAASEEPLLKSVINADDFYSTSECRDLLFHVQEHRTTLPEIKSFLTQNGAQFAGFFLDAATQRRFATRFPEPTSAADLDRWHAFEMDAPATFVAMYQFSLRKSG